MKLTVRQLKQLIREAVQGLETVEPGLASPMSFSVGEGKKYAQQLIEKLPGYISLIEKGKVEDAGIYFINLLADPIENLLDSNQHKFNTND